jgi:hypothetical protein
LRISISTLVCTAENADGATTCEFDENSAFAAMAIAGLTLFAA